MAHFLEVMRDGAAPRTTVADGVRALELADAATRSWRSGQVVKLIRSKSLFTISRARARQGVAAEKAECTNGT